MTIKPYNSNLSIRKNNVCANIDKNLSFGFKKPKFLEKISDAFNTEKKDFAGIELDKLNEDEKENLSKVVFEDTFLGLTPEEMEEWADAAFCSKSFKKILMLFKNSWTLSTNSGSGNVLQQMKQEADRQNRIGILELEADKIMGKMKKLKLSDEECQKLRDDFLKERIGKSRCNKSK